MTSPLTKSQPAAGATTQIVTGGCTLNRVIVGTPAAVTAEFYDNTATSGTPILAIPASVPAGTIYNVDVPCTLGLRAVLGAALGLTVLYSNG